MPLLIDGYNLLHVSGILGRDAGSGSLQESRSALLNFLADSLGPEERSHVTIVFDAQEAPWGLPRVVEHQGIQVHFASQHESADALIEELIAADSAPRRLVVVSSDHRIQRAARRRRAKAVDSDVWFAALLRSRQGHEQADETSARPAVPLLEENVNYWIRQFGGESALQEFLEREVGDVASPTQSPAKKPAAKNSQAKKSADRQRRRAPKSPSEKFPADIENLHNPFPPGYGEDLLKDP